MQSESFSRPQRRALKAAVSPVNHLTSEHKLRMFQLMRSYYDAITEAQFLSDLSKKDAVIVLKDRNNTIQGFSTLVNVRASLNGKPLRAIFSGDTVIDKQYWGQRQLGKAFLGYLFAEKAKAPFEPLYWLLISKGYKTYLMMANNFAHHYPRFERPTPARARQLLDAFYSTLYPEQYNPQTGLVEAPGEVCRLKPAVACIPASLLKSNPRVAFFEQSNPRWHEGAQLACIARMTLRMPLQYAFKEIMKDRVIKAARRFARSLFPLPEESDKV